VLENVNKMKGKKTIGEEKGWLKRQLGAIFD
jgi:hypothetical protein